MNALASLLTTSILTVASATVGWGQQHPGIYTTSQEYAQNQPLHPGAVAPLHPGLAYLEVVNAHTHAVHRVPLASVWGYADAKGQGFRLVERKAYAVHPQQDNLVTYSRQRAIQHSRSKHIITEHFYSQTLDGQLHPLTKRALKQQQATAK